MQTIIKIICYFVAVFVMINGIWVAFTPPFGDEPVGMAIVAVGIFIGIITFSMAKMTESRTSD